MNNLNYSYERSFSLFSQDDLTISTKKDNDRFIPNRKGSESDLTNYDTPPDSPSCKMRDRQRTATSLGKSIPIFTSNSPNSSNKRKYSSILKNDILGKTKYKKGSILSFGSSSQKSCLSKRDPYQDLKVISAINMDFTFNSSLANRSLPLPKRPFKVLDAPDMEDDFYKQLLHWNSSNNKIAIGLSNSVYIWDSETGAADLLCEFFEYEELCSLRWNQDGSQLAFGMGSGEIKLWDIQKNESVQSVVGHVSRVGCLDWTHKGLFSGSRDKNVQMVDPRIQDFYALQFAGHSRQVLNVRCANFDQPFVLSCGNDSKVKVFDLRNETASIFSEAHEGPVRAIDWSPIKKNQFASGGGSTDKMLKLWDLNKKKLKDQVFTGAQICDLKFGKLDKEIFVGLGEERNSVEVFSLNSLHKVGRLKGHSLRVLNLEISPDHTELVSVSGDETMRFWKVSQLTRQRSKTEATPLPNFGKMFGMR